MSKFKVGDVAITNHLYDDGLFSKAPKIGKLYKITKVEGTEYVSIEPIGFKDDLLVYDGWFASRFTLASQAEIDYMNFPNKLEDIINS